MEQKRIMSSEVIFSKETRGRFVYISGTKPLFSVGDVLAEKYNSVEIVHGTVKEINYNEAVDDWIYSFEEGDFTVSEQYLVGNEVYVKSRKGDKI